MKGVAVHKVPGGKLIRANVDYGYSINEVKLTGDFFLHPEESIEHIEKVLRGVDRDLPHDEMARMIKDAVESNGIILLGVTEDAIAGVVKEAMK